MRHSGHEGRSLFLAAGAATIVLLGAAALAAGCTTSQGSVPASERASAFATISPYVVVDCVLPPQLIAQGTQSMHMLPSRPAKLSARECGKQGGAQTLGIDAWSRLAETDPEAQTYLGEMYEHGMGGAPRDLVKAIALYEKAKARSPRAAMNLALLERDPAKVAAHMKQAAAAYGVNGKDIDIVPASRPVPQYPVANESGAIIDLRRFNFGSYYALLIGNGDYQYARKLTSPPFEIDAIGKILQGRYGFRVIKLKNATAEEILRSLDDLSSELTASDNLLVYYTGHGAESESKEGYWIPVDGEAPDSKGAYRTAHWIASSTVREKLAVMKPRHILVVADSCYSARFLQFKGVLRASPATTVYLDSFKALYTAKSRTAFTSGGLEPVVESIDGGRMSVFAKEFVKFLENNRTPVESVRIFSAIGPDVFRQTSIIGFAQQPQWGPITGAGHESGDFWFIPK